MSGAMVQRDWGDLETLTGFVASDGCDLLASGSRFQVTGASSGLGHSLVEVVLQRNDKVIAACRNPSALAFPTATSANFIAVICDVTSQQDILHAFAAGITKFGQVDVVFNGAGLAMSGELEAVPEDAAKALFDVNVWGALNVSKEAMRVFRDVNPVKGGRLLNVSSGIGIVGMPVCGIYAASKHALEGLTESLAMELDPSWNIKVCLSFLQNQKVPTSVGISIIAPGAFKTGIHTARTITFPAPTAYSKPELPSRWVRNWFDDESAIRGDPIAASEAFYRFTLLESPPMRWAVGKDAIAGARKKIELVKKETDAYESWSDMLELP
ncbi:NAD-P-binding protein [Mycena indigotica]|uniref:NAD-P-binding protein n=1 Tax=Mycena indigotica TaxID=2126181 RepID=A0A8H6SU90_9AGAR|nr:NAD-P-binding protein [Mycena indigotica]KAF7306275.1 NAD-P-binding protein [Mycena indigotica]